MVSRGVQKTTGETAGFWRDTGFDRLQQRAGTEHHEQTKRQADQPADNLAGSLPFSAPCSISNERSVFAMCILRFVFFVCFYCSTVLLMRKAHVSHVLHCNSAYILFCPKRKKKCRKLAFSALWKHEYMISACWTSRALCWPCQTSGDFFAFHLIFGLILRFFYTSDSNFHPRA